jgi:hypothetical protein
MTSPESLNRYDEHSAAVLIGLSLTDIRRLAEKSRLGQKVKQGEHEHIVFSYPELLELSLLAARGNS